MKYLKLVLNLTCICKIINANNNNLELPSRLHFLKIGLLMLQVSLSINKERNLEV